MKRNARMTSNGLAGPQRLAAKTYLVDYDLYPALAMALWPLSLSSHVMSVTILVPTDRHPGMRKQPAAAGATRAPVFVRVKPLGAGKTGTSETRGSLRLGEAVNQFHINGKPFDFPTAVVSDRDTNEGAYVLGDVDSYVSDFLDGMDVNLLAYGQTGSGKTHTVFGPPGLMERAGSGEFGTEIIPEYGLFPRALYAILDRLQELRASGRILVLTASAVELSYGMNLDMLFGKMPAFTNMQVKPAKLYGQTEITLSTRDDAIGLFAALATRNSRATLMNDSSSRSHCFVTLNLLEATAGEGVRESRLQFVDMAGSERLKDAHGKVLGYEALGKAENMGYAEGMNTNYSLMMLSQCIREVAKARKPEEMSFRAYKIDLVFLLQASLTGSARTILFVMLHQSKECDSQSYNACDFGLHFSTIRLKPARRPTRKAAELIKQADAERKEAEAALARGCVGKDPRSYADIKDIRAAQVRSSKQTIKLLKMLLNGGGGGGIGGDGGGGGGDGSLGGTPRDGRLGSSSGGAAAAMRFRFADSMFTYRLNGLWDEQGAAEQRFGDGLDWNKECAKPVHLARKEFADGMQDILNYNKKNRWHAERQTTSAFEIDCRSYGGDNDGLRVLVHTPKATKAGAQSGRRGIIYFHGGGTVVGSASDFAKNGVAPRLAADSGAVVFNVDYRLTPDYKVPAAISDGVCAIRHVIAHAGELGLDPTKLAVAGESGGGYVAVGACAELARHGESKNVALLLAISPQTTNFYLRATPEELEAMSPNGLRMDLYAVMMSTLNRTMLGHRPDGSSGAKALADHADDVQLFPNLMDEATARALPPTVVFTSEFDFLRVAAEELAALLERSGRLLDYCCHPSCTHCWWMMMDHPKAERFYDDVAKVFAKWL